MFDLRLPAAQRTGLTVADGGSALALAKIF